MNTISNDYYSNCLIEALRAKIRGCGVKLYFCKPQMSNNHFQMFHIMWSDGTADYDFSDSEESDLPFWKTLLYKGHIRQFDLGFAERYSRQRNTMRKELKKAHKGYIKSITKLRGR